MSRALFFEMSLIKGKTTKRNATWKDLENFFEKKKEEILSDMKSCLSEEEVCAIISKIELNEHRKFDRLAPCVC